MIVRWSRRQRGRPPRWRAPRALLLLLLLLVALLAATPTLVVAQLSGPPTSTPDPPPAASPAPPAGEDGTSTGASPPGGGGGDGGATDAGPDPYAGMEGFPGSVSDVTGARYQDLVDDAARRSNETNGTTFAGANNPYLWLYGDKVVEEELNPRLICRGGCVDPEALGVLLVWCAAPVDYLFCNRTLAGPTETSILNMESGAIAAYMSLVRRVPKAGEECKTILRKWMCYEFFNRCNTDETEFFPVCQTTCEAARYACGKPQFMDCTQEVEELEGHYPEEWNDANGNYIRNPNKPGGAEGTPVFEADELRCTGASGRRWGVAPAEAARVAVVAALFALVTVAS